MQLASDKRSWRATCSSLKMIEELVAHLLTAFTEIVAGLHNSVVHTPSILNLGKYLMIFSILPFAAVIAYDHYFPIFKGVNLYVVFVIATPITIITPALVFAVFRYFGGQWLVNWHLKKTSRYLKFCRLPSDSTKSLLPNDTVRWHYQLVGSAADHGFGFFPLPSTNFGIFPWSNTFLVQDVDINIFYKPLLLSLDNIIPTSPGYCKVIMKEFAYDAFLQDCIVKSGSQPLLSGKLISEKIGKEFAGIRDIEFNYPAITFKSILEGPRGKFRFDSDVAFGVKIFDSEGLVYDWFERVQKIFPNELISSIRSVGCYLVHKHCLLHHLSHDFDWRLTFAEAESKVFEYHSDKRALKLCYAVIKFAVKQFSQVKKKNYPALKSYHLKTLILWIAEQSEKLPLDMYTIDNNKTLCGLLLHIIATYRQHIYNGYLQHYFISHVNILEPYGVYERTEAMHLLDEFKMKPLSIVSNFDNANLSRWKFDQFIIVGLLAVIACMWINFYFSNVGKIFEGASVVRQIFGVCAVFVVIGFVKIILD